MATSTSRRAELTLTVRGRRLAATVAVAAVAIAATLILASRSSLFHMRHLDVVGTSDLSRTQVVRLAGIPSSTNVLWFDAGAVERRLESDPWIAHATVSRRLPWTIRISVSERAAVAVVRNGRGFTLLAADGVALGTVEGDPALPEIVVGSASSLVLGAEAAAARAIAGLKGGGRPTVVRAVVSPDDTLSVEFDGGARLDFGDLTQIEAKSRAARRILRWAKAQGASVVTIDVTAPDAPAATFG